MFCINNFIRLFFTISLLALSTLVSANTIPTQSFDGTEINLEEFEMGYFIDQEENMSFEDVRLEPFQLSKNSLTLGPNAKTTWVKIQLKSITPDILKIYLHHPYIYHNIGAELYEVVEGKVTNKRMINMNKSEAQRELYHGSAVFDIELQPNQEMTLFLKLTAFSHQWFSLSLYDEGQSKRALMGQYTEIALLVGMFLALIIYNLILFFSSRLNEHLYYACYLLSGGAWVALYYGLFADSFGVFGTDVLKGHIVLAGIPIFLCLFMINVFETRKKYPIEHWTLISTLVLFISELIYGILDIVTALHISTILAGIMMVISFLVSLSMLIRKHPIAPFFLLGHGLFIIFSTMALLFYRGLADFNYINIHGVGIGIMLEALVLSLIIAYRVRMLEKLKVSQVELTVLASTDPLTQLFNRRHFKIAANLLLTKQEKHPMSIIMMDIDKFKNINDTYGHNIGDKVIVAVANIIKSNGRPIDVLARYGGEEFILLLPNASQDEAYTIAERIRESVRTIHIPMKDAQHQPFTMSLGIAEVPTNSTDLQEAINRADKALYKAKNNGRNQTQV